MTVNTTANPHDSDTAAGGNAGPATAAHCGRSVGAGLSDTRPEAERVQIELLRKAGCARRLQLAFDLSQSVVELSRHGLRKRHPDLPEQELQLKFVALCYGDALAERVREHLRRMRP